MTQKESRALLLNDQYAAMYEGILHCEDGGHPGSCGCPILGNVQGPAGQGSDRPGLMEDVSDCSGGLD